MTWRTVQLGTVLVPSRNYVRIEPNNSYMQITARLWGKGLELRGVCNGSEIAAERQVAVNEGDFLISKIDARHGAFGLVPKALSGAVVSNDFPCFAINNEVMDSDFLNWFSKTGSFIELCKRSSMGSTNRVRLKEDQFLQLEIPQPELNEQRRIAHQLNRVQTSLQDRLSTLDEIERDTEAMLQNAFLEIVHGAEYRPLAEVAPLVRRPVQIELDGEYPELGARSFGRGLFHKPAMLGAEVSWEKLFWIHEGDLVFSNIKAWEGAFGVASTKDHLRVGSHRYLTCVAKPDVATPNFIWFYLQSRDGLAKIDRASPGSADRNRTLGQKALEAITVPVPDIKAQRQFDRLCAYVDEIRAIRSATAKEAEALLPAMLHDIFERKAVVSVEATKPNENVVSLPQAQPLSIDTPFKEAVLVGAIIKAFHKEGGQPLGNFRLQKAVYFARRFMGESALDQQYLRKAAGPYNPKMRYSGGVKIALEKNWIAPATSSHSTGHSPGSAFDDASAWIEKYQFAQPAAWVRDKFMFKKNDIWELLATVDYAMLALEHAGSTPTAATVFAYIGNDEEWRPKIEKLRLSEASIQNAMVELRSLFDSVGI